MPPGSALPPPGMMPPGSALPPPSALGAGVGGDLLPPGSSFEDQLMREAMLQAQESEAAEVGFCCCCCCSVLDPQLKSLFALVLRCLIMIVPAPRIRVRLVGPCLLEVPPAAATPTIRLPLPTTAPLPPRMVVCRCQVAWRTALPPRPRARRTLLPRLALSSRRCRRRWSLCTTMRR